MSVSGSGRNKEVAAEIVAFVMKHPRSVASLADAMGVKANGDARDRLRSWLQAYHKAGLFYIQEYTPNGGPIYAMQPSLFRFDDCPMNSAAVARAEARKFRYRTRADLQSSA